VRPLALTLLVLVVVSVSMTAAAVLYGGATVGVPYPEPTPAQAASERHHMGVFDQLMLGAGVCWLVTLGAAVGLGVRWLAKRKRTEGVR
jgi:hypothetical protein